MKKQALFKVVSTVIISAILLTGCGGGASNSSEQTLNIPLSAEPPTLDPGLAEDSTSGAIIRQVFEGLTRIGEDDLPHEAAAEKIEISDDLKTYTFTIREGAKWSNGEPLTANDFEYTWKRVLNPATAANYAYQLYYIKNGEAYNKGQIDDPEQVGVKALDARTLQVELENPTPFFLELTAFYTYMPVNKAVVTENADWANDATEKYVSNGPFKLKTWKHSSKVEIEKNEHYWDYEKVKLDQINFSIVEDESTALNMFENGELDWAGRPTSDLPKDALQTLKDQDRLVIMPITGTYWYKFNTEQPPFTNAKARKAFAYAIDRQTIIENVTQADEIPAMGAIPPTVAVHEGDYFKDHDVEEANRLLDEGLQELGMTRDQLSVSLSYNTNEAHAKIAQAIQDQWKQALGVDVKLSNAEWKVYIEDLHQGNFEIGRMGWLADYDDPVTFLELYKDKHGGNNDTLWENAQYQQLLTQSDQETDPAKRKELLAQAEQILMDEMPIAPIYFYTQSYVKTDKVKGVILHGTGDIDYKYAYVEE
ncbi:peptide ABC transporter substrate-binding protein [Ammoniphilus oxalaticus]|uniref:peptide ABC transporter substrate-binding protein n=1 Tax=Ammoniphilus oxalaticus TaxID=66863 RepID=UPI000E7393FC|nr:peptide ABC transporter substrate-binding protein [Ammoniphilus oxalaticus]